MKLSTLRITFVAFVLVALAAVFSPAPAEACMGPCVLLYCDGTYCYYLCEVSAASGVAPAGETIVTRLGPTKARIEVSAYTTPGMSNTYACSVAFPEVDGIKAIDKVRLVETMSRKVLDNYNWVPDGNSIFEFSQMSRDAGIPASRKGGWQGFFTEVQGGSIGGIQHSFVLDVTLESGTTTEQLVEALKKQGVLANGSANFDGSLDFGHYHLRRLGDGRIRVAPTSGGREKEGPAQN